MKSALLSFFIYLSSGAFSLAADPVRVMCVGDSITQGGKTFATYRLPLAQKLKAAGFKVEFVGSQRSDGPDGPLWHEGYGGKNAEFLASVLNAKIKQNPADVLLIHAGHNHSAEEKPVPGIIAATRSMIEIARQRNPRVIILVAQVIPSGKLPKYSYLPELNSALVGMVRSLNTPAQLVGLVNLAEGFDPAKDTIADLVHPNAQGAEKMATHWYEALKFVLKK